MKKTLLLYFSITKPRISMLVLVTAYLGYYMGQRSLGNHLTDLNGYINLIYLLLGTWATSGSAAILNQVIEKNQDSKMNRTKNRPIVVGDIKINNAILFALLIGFLGFVLLYTLVNPITAWISVITVILYICIYTPSKQITTWNTIIGSVPGALPPVGGWTAATGSLEPTAWILFGILFCWQMPHFLAIAIIYASDYQKGGFKMLPTIYPESRRTSYVILFFSIALIVVSLGLYILKAVGIFYAICAAVLGVIFFIISIQVMIKTDKKSAKRLMVASIIYLPILLLIILLERVVY
tara:strand:- start:1303 stop:2187 length:885 start_codon:yes stop_codon:yes gene_type:complete